ncbi:HvfA family oxazolone/thioamide-modified RiPP metallophore, partial [Marinobacterium jannaschii]
MANNTIKPIVAAVGAAFIAGVATTSVANAAENPFAATDLSAGYQVAEAKKVEGKCGEGKCGGEKTKAEGKCGEGKCGGEKTKAEGK